MANLNKTLKVLAGKKTKMISQEMLNYIKRQRILGKNDAEIRASLAAAGWPGININAGFANLDGNGAPPPAPGARTDLPKIRQLFSDSFGLMKQRILVMFVSGLLPMLGLLGGGILAWIIWFILSRLNSTAGTVVGALFIIGLIVGYVYAIFWSSTSFIVALRDAPENTGIKENLKRSRPLIWSFLLVGILVNLVVVGGIVLLIVPGIMFMVWYGLAAMVMVTEGKKGRLALAQSKAYVKGRSWGVFGRILLVYLVCFAPYIILRILASIFKTSPVINISLLILSFLVYLFGIFYAMAFTYTLYKHARDTAGPVDAERYKGGVTGWAIWGVVGWTLMIIATVSILSLIVISSVRSKATPNNIYQPQNLNSSQGVY